MPRKNCIRKNGTRKIKKRLRKERQKLMIQPKGKNSTRNSKERRKNMRQQSGKRELRNIALLLVNI
jgi:hypothetical protein